jgi:hypothetical protein
MTNMLDKRERREERKKFEELFEHLQEKHANVLPCVYAISNFNGIVMSIVIYTNWLFIGSTGLSGFDISITMKK